MKVSRHRLVLYSLIGLTYVVAGVMMLSSDIKQPSTAIEVFIESEAPIVTTSTDEPSESQQEAVSFNWRGKQTEPKKIIIPKLSVDAFIQKVGIDQNRLMAVPTNIHLAGWFADSVRPGDNGLSIIDGHVSGPTTDGVFRRIGELATGDEIIIEQGAGARIAYRVTSVQSVLTAEAAPILFNQSPEVLSQLNLITCDGVYDESTRSFERRIIVTSARQ